MRLAIYGPQGSGKSTQAKLLSEKFGIPVISAGQISRQIAAENTPEGKKVKALIEAGNPTPTEILAPRIERAILSPEAKNGFILDGFPRFPDQIEQIVAILDRQGRQLDHALLIKLSDEEGIKRILSRATIEGRTDDTPEAIKRRLDLYHQQTEPIISYFRNLSKLIEIDGSGTIEEVHELILAALKK